MDANAKKTALRMIPYGLYVLTAKGKDGALTAATVNWVTQASFAPPLVVVGVKADSHPHPVIKEAKAFALSVLGKDQGPTAFTFFKPATVEGQKISGEPFHAGTTGAPILDRAPAFVECRLVESIERGDHSIFVGEVVEAGVAKAPDGRPDDATLWLKDLAPTSSTAAEPGPAAATGLARVFANTRSAGRGGARRRGRGSAPAASPARLNRRPAGGANRRQKIPRRIGRSVVDGDQFRALQSLRQDAREGFGDPRRTVIDGHQD